LDGVLRAQPLFTLELARDGAILRTYGSVIEPLIDGALPANFMSLGEDPAALGRELVTAFQTGAADFFFSPAFGDRPWLAASLRRRGAGLIAVLRDDSGHGAREAALAEAAQEAIAASQGKSRFLANMSHELRTPLNAIVGFSDIMRAEMFGPLDPKYAEYASLIHESGGHLLELINDVLDMSKIEAERYSLALETCDAREPVAAAVRLMRIQAETANVRLLPALPQEPVRVRADRRALKQIVLNLLSNAIKFTPSGGRVSVMLKAQGGEVEIIVADDGIGISAEDLARLGTPFEQAGDAQQRARGSGLGLSLVRAFAELHGGRMEVASESGAGTTVEVRLPILIEADAYRGAQASQASGVEPSPAALGKNVIRFAPERRT
ncbi:MAG: sensor histidine kinase, partial [Caulobacteraceae bacterium]